MDSKECEHFINRGFGWVCKNCETSLPKNRSEKSRLMNEGEAESKTENFSSEHLAKWKDTERKILFCPNCSVAERVSSVS